MVNIILNFLALVSNYTFLDFLLLKIENISIPQAHSRSFTFSLKSEEYKRSPLASINENMGLAQNYFVKKNCNHIENRKMHDIVNLKGNNSVSDRYENHVIHHRKSSIQNRSKKFFRMFGSKWRNERTRAVIFSHSNNLSHFAIFDSKPRLLRHQFDVRHPEF